MAFMALEGEITGGAERWRRLDDTDDQFHGRPVPRLYFSIAAQAACRLLDGLFRGKSKFHFLEAQLP